MTPTSPQEANARRLLGFLLPIVVSAITQALQSKALGLPGWIVTFVLGGLGALQAHWNLKATPPTPS